MFLDDKTTESITMHAIADQSIDNLHINCVYGQIQLQTAVTKVEDGYKLKYDVYQVPKSYNFFYRNIVCFFSDRM